MCFHMHKFIDKIFSFSPPFIFTGTTARMLEAVPTDSGGAGAIIGAVIAAILALLVVIIASVIIFILVR